ncbi:hypothetical protein MIND_01158500 [Mycena indigotica]|uniref:Uncharacterized protein n=1 Tax=Mycena indigotica TaxID=2126181 RepID=A0A8H6VUN5_9AGAR|nr:uncharacterized protein MIND_01158500 [Mycena indigotica]KAF7292606.1 hypothetical protein MIND_01158500 [Mycena indigotica]
MAGPGNRATRVRLLRPHKLHCVCFDLPLALPWHKSRIDTLSPSLSTSGQLCYPPPAPLRRSLWAPHKTSSVVTVAIESLARTWMEPDTTTARNGPATGPLLTHATPFIQLEIDRTIRSESRLSLAETNLDSDTDSRVGDWGYSDSDEIERVGDLEEWQSLATENGRANNGAQTALPLFFPDPDAANSDSGIDDTSASDSDGADADESSIGDNDSDAPPTSDSEDEEEPGSVTYHSDFDEAPELDAELVFWLHENSNQLTTTHPAQSTIAFETRAQRAAPKIGHLLWFLLSEDGILNALFDGQY